MEPLDPTSARLLAADPGALGAELTSKTDGLRAAARELQARARWLLRLAERLDALGSACDALDRSDDE